MLWMPRSGACGSALRAPKRLALLMRASILRSAVTPPSQQAIMGLPQTGDRPKNASLRWIVAGVASEADRDFVS